MNPYPRLVSSKHIFGLAHGAFALLVATTTTVAAPTGAIIKPFQTTVNLEGYRLVWSDEFDGRTLNTTEWHYRTDSKMNSTQLPGNVSVVDGKLRLALKKEKAGDKNYTGGGVISKRHFAYGYYEARIKMPASRGWHTSFWMAGFDDMKPGQGASGGKHELDVCEQDSFEATSYTHNLHMRKPVGKSLGWTRIRTPNLTTDFHVWGCEFTPEAVRYFFDGQLVGTYDITPYEKGDVQIWLTSIAANLGNKTGDPVDRELPDYAWFDYVRFFARK
jgi:beta-glucanase (GH16 family)